jgi:hypothetical protein
MPRILLSAAVAAVLFPGNLLAQQQPDFSGTWVMDAARSGSAAQGAYVSPATPVTVVIVQSSAGLKVQTDADGRREVVDFKLRGPDEDLARPVGTSGSNVVSPRPVGSGGLAERIEQMANDTGVDDAFLEWKDDRLVTTTHYRLNGMAVTKVETRSLAKNGNEMMVETQVTVQHGYEARGGEGQPYTTVQDVYVKTRR